MEDQNRKPDTPKDPALEHIARLAAKAHLSPEYRLAYDRAVDRYNVDRLVEKETIREAEERGIKKGQQEARLEMARQLKLNGVPTDIIARSSGLSKEEIERL